MGIEGSRKVWLPSDMKKLSFLLDAEGPELTGNNSLWELAYEMNEEKVPEDEANSVCWY